MRKNNADDKVATARRWLELLEDHWITVILGAMALGAVVNAVTGR